MRSSGRSPSMALWKRTGLTTLKMMRPGNGQRGIIIFTIAQCFYHFIPRQDKKSWIGLGGQVP